MPSSGDPERSDNRDRHTPTHHYRDPQPARANPAATAATHSHRSAPGSTIKLHSAGSLTTTASAANGLGRAVTAGRLLPAGSGDRPGHLRCSTHPPAPTVYAEG